MDKKIENELNKMKDCISQNILTRLLIKNHHPINEIEEEVMAILRKGTKKEIDVLLFLLCPQDHISEYILDSLKKIKSLSTVTQEHNSNKKKA